LYVIKDIGLCQIGEEDTILTKSPAFQRILDTVKTVAEYDVNVLLEGETGTGKIEHAVITCRGSLIKPEDIPLEKESKPLEEMERIGMI
ncbi:MAG: sigma 54-interacting transcriptional regulator, partial [Aquificaceae bacterium]